ncbi:MAG: MaoC family dehydratase N-terminal domain-containing protein [Deltaproteobacteria bacterium]|nr:MaoC family dehydratase N-terminal domain-containing protein [Deltaproteobacteria bacterium]
MSETETAKPSTDKAALLQRLRTYVGREAGPAFTARDPVNQPMIRHWCDAVGDTNPVYTDPEFAARSIHKGIVAPPTMMQAWTMRGLMPPPKEPDTLNQLLGILAEASFTSVVATNCEQEYVRYVRPGDLLTATTIIEEVSEEKQTALGAGHFVSIPTTFRDQQGEVVGKMQFRILLFRPAQAAAAPAAEGGAPAKPRRPRPVICPDNAFFWDGVKRKELLIQRCTGCGALRHPPRPMCPSCQSLAWDAVKASGRGTVYSFVVIHHPPFPPFDYPHVVAVVDLAEGTRLVANLIGIDPKAVTIGMPVQVDFVAVDEELTLPQFRPAA